jgi:peptidoglycan/LPS O-acetylase OafA/YrhL
MPGAAVLLKSDRSMDVAYSSSPIERGDWGYLPEIDGLRAIAILAVLMFHFDRQIFGGGFVGVDIFFVISGFLITSILLNDINQGRFSILRFYQRRIARIAPAFFVVLVATLLAARFVYSAQDFAKLGALSLAAALSAINLKLLFQGTYFQSSPDAQAILHYWSLSVEEQFYLFFPLYLYAVLRFTRQPLAVTLAVSAGSFVACVVVTHFAPNFAFYLLPTRAWELLMGAGLALFRQTGRSISPRAASTAGWGGLTLLLLSLLLISPENHFPGWVAMFPVFGTTLVLASIQKGGGGLIQALLAHRLPVYIGKRSYSLYLWHWPIFSLVDYQYFLTSSSFRLSLKILVCVVATLLSYKFVEQPLRTYLSVGSRRSLAFGGFTLAAAAICAAGTEIRLHDYLSADPGQIAAGGIAIEGNGQGTVALIGDSQAAMYGRELASIAREQGFSLDVLGAAATNELPNEPGTRWTDVEKYLTERRPNVVIVAEAWSSKLDGDGRDLRKALDTMEALGSRVILITQPPVLPLPDVRAAIRNGAAPSFFEDRATLEKRLIASASVRALANGKVSVLDIGDLFTCDGGAILAIARDGRSTYHDSTHLSDSGTALVRPMLESAIASALRPR